MITAGNSRVHPALKAIVGCSDWARDVRAFIEDVANYSSNVLITGPSGTGKELISRAIHALSRRAEKRFVPVDCASITGTLFASHLFGHLKGAFTGATCATIGCFRAADQGTIFLDEIGELELDLQAKLLRILQERIVVPVGGHEGSPVDVRIIAATNQNLPEEVAAGRFRLDLYYRLNVIAVQTVALKDRSEDIEPLARHILAKLNVHHGMPLKRLSAAALEQMRCYDWPGNVRQLENALERAVLFSRGDVIGAEHVAHAIADESHAQLLPMTIAADAEARWPTAAEAERQHLHNTLEHVGYNLSAAAGLLDLDRHSLRRRISKHGLDISAARPGRPSVRSVPWKKAA